MILVCHILPKLLPVEYTKRRLGETYVPFCYQPTPDIEALRRAGYRIVGA